MRVNANSLTTNLIVTVLTLVMVFLLPWLDRRICNRLGLNLQGGLSKKPNASSLLKLRQMLLVALLGVYLVTLAYLVIFSRTATKDYQVHVALFEDLQRSIHIDFGPFEILQIFLTKGIREGLSHIKIVTPEDIAQVYMNIMLFVPMGYLLPYVFEWFRAKVHYRPAVACFLISFLIENLQLITRRGFYDMDDLVSNTIGGLLGQYLFISVAYVVTHPSWRKELASYRRWRRNARSRTLYPFARRITLSRTTLQATNEERIWDFYVMKLGFYVKKQLVPLDSPETSFLFEMGKSQIEIHCSNMVEELGKQYLTISAKHLNAIISRLRANGIQTSEIDQDPYTGLRRIQFEGPDHVCITVIEV